MRGSTPKRNEKETVDGAREAAGAETYFRHRSVGECISGVLGVYTSRFVDFSKHFLPLLLLLALCVTVCVYGTELLLLGKSEDGGMLAWMAPAVVLGFALYSVVDAALYVYYGADKEDLDLGSRSLAGFFKKSVSLFPKVLVVNIIVLLYWAAALYVSALVLSVKVDEIGTAVVVYISLSLLLMVFIAFAFPFGTARVAALNEGGNVLLSLLRGYKTGAVKLGKVATLKIVLAIIGFIAFVLLAAPAAVVSLIQLYSAASVLEGDSVSLPASTEALVACVMFLSVLLASYLVAFMRIPVCALYGSLCYDKRETRGL